MSPMNRRFILTLSFDAYASQRMNNIGSLIRRKHKRAVDMFDHAILADYMGSLPALKEGWNKHAENIEGRFSAGTARIKRVADARERLRVAVGIFDIIDQAFKNSNNGKTLFNSDFRNDCSMLTTMDSNAHYDAYHGLQRAIEEFPMLKDNAASVIKHGKDIVSKLEVVVNVLLPDDMQDRAAAQERRRAGIADGLKFPVIFSAEENGEEEEGDEFDEKEEANHAELIDYFHKIW
ncbi:hypothetical protein BDC45DRAFT_573485 [Circinella umbellata]|nr:hypothetical protein BDC45DRAFT_573485 [Circinella umbellata]